MSKPSENRGLTKLWTEETEEVFGLSPLNWGREVITAVAIIVVSRGMKDQSSGFERICIN